MHGEFPKQLLAKARGSKHRSLAIGAVLLVVIGALYYVFGGPTTQQRRASRFGAEGPVPVVVAAVTRADVPVYLDAVGTIRALNTVTVSPRAQQNLGLRTAEVVQGTLAPQLQAIGNIAWNERDQSVVQARAAGFIEHLYVRASLVTCDRSPARSASAARPVSTAASSTSE